jgi:hypothetical protein
MNDLLNLNENSNESNLNSLDDIITNNANKMNQEENLNQNQDNVMKGIDDIIVHNSENLGSINVDISDKESLHKDNIKSSENEPLKKSHDSSEVIQVPEIEKEFEPPFAQSQNTLDESILTTITRDLQLIYTKLKFVVIPNQPKNLKTWHIKRWDLWGPLILDLLLACTLAINSRDKSQMIILIFVIFWLGGVILFLNANFLGVKSSIFQMFCLLGYCLFPLNLSAIFVTIFKLNAILRLIVVGVACFWSIYSSSDFLSTITNQDQRYLVLYPCILFYLYISWFIISTKTY